MNEAINKLRWRCRRGTLELDLMLLRYLDTNFLAADSSEQNAFLQLLDQEDTELMRYLMGERLPQDQHLATLVSVIRNLPA